MMPRQAPDLRGCAAKLRRADSLFAELDALALAFIERGNPYRAEPTFDNETQEIVFRLTQDVIQPPSDEWGPLMGDCAHNLMSALDHLVCQLSILNRGDQDCATTEFPIFERDSQLTRNQIEKKIGTLDPGDQELIVELQPFQRGADARTDPLWLLRRINIIDKHRRMHLVSTGIYERSIVAQETVELSIEDVVISEGTKAGDEIIRFHPEDVRREEAIRTFGPVVVVTFSDPGGALDRVSIRSVFPEITAHLRGRVFPKFEHRVGKVP